MKVLIAEDDIISRTVLEKNIKDWGYDVTIAGDGEKAWQKIKSENIRFAILDWTMPKLNGLELCRKIREDYCKNNSKYTYVILLTGRDQQENISTGLTAGADDYMTKPYDAKDLKIRIQKGKKILHMEDNRLNPSHNIG